MFNRANLTPVEAPRKLSGLRTWQTHRDCRNACSRLLSLPWLTCAGIRCRSPVSRSSLTVRQLLCPSVTNAWTRIHRRANCPNVALRPRARSPLRSAAIALGSRRGDRCTMNASGTPSESRAGSAHYSPITDHRLVRRSRLLRRSGCEGWIARRRTRPP